MLEQERKINNEMAMGGMLTKYQDGSMVGNPDRVAVGAINPRTGQPYSMEEVASYTNSQKMLPTSFGTQYGGLNSQGNEVYANYEQPLEKMAATNTINFPNSPANPNYVKPAAFDPFNVSKWTDMNNPMDRIQKTVGNKLVPTLPQRVGTGNYGEFYLPKKGQAYTDAVVQNSQVTPEEIQQANAMGNFPTGVNNTTEPSGFFNKAGQFIQDNPGLIGQLGTAAITAGAQMNRINKLARPRTLGDVRLTDKVVNPNLVDYSAERQAYNRMGLNAMDEAQRGFGSSAAAQAFKNKARLNTLEGTGKSYQSQENTNAQIRNAANMARQEAGMREAMMNNEIDKYNLENVYGYDTMTTAQKNAITAMLGNTAGQTFGKQTDYANQLEQAKILANARENTVNFDTIVGSKQDTKEYYMTLPEQQKVQYNAARARRNLTPYGYGGIMKRSFRNGGTNNPGFNALPESVQENILDNMGMGGYMYSLGGRLMDEPMYGEGGVTTKNTLGLTGDYSRSNTPQNILSNYNLKADYARKFGDFNAGLNANLGFENTLPMKPEEVSVMRPNATVGVNLNYERPTSNFGTTFNYNPLNQDINANLTYRKRFAKGGIHIKPSKVGSLRKHLGVPEGQKIPVSKLADKPGDSPAIKKKKVFSRNARKWKH
jgi:hypothetical protein